MIDNMTMLKRSEMEDEEELKKPRVWTTNDDKSQQQQQQADAQELELGRKCNARFVVVLLGLLIAMVNCYAQMTFCISIVEMVVPADLNALATTSSSNSTLSNSDLSCPIEYRYRDYYDEWRFANATSSTVWNALSNTSTTTVTRHETKVNPAAIDLSNRFAWDASQQGLLLGAFAFGTAPLQVVGGRLAEIYGAKWVLLACCIGTALTNLTIPWLAHFSFKLLILNRVLMGVSQAGMEPGLMCLIAEWLAPAETGFFISMLLFAICVGCFLGSLGSSFVLTLSAGWPLTYYVAGVANLLVGAIWLAYASSRPHESRVITRAELRYIRNAQARTNPGQLGGATTNTTKLLSASPTPTLIVAATNDEPRSVDGQSSDLMNTSSHISSKPAAAPWLNILSTRSVWAFILCKVSIRWCADVLGIELPTYLANVLHLSIKLNGILNSISAALFAVCSLAIGYVVNELSKGYDDNNNSNTKCLSKTSLRKLFQAVASFGSAITMLLMTHYDCNILFSMAMLLLLCCCIVMGTGGELQIPYDMTSRYPGTLHGMACTLSVSGWLAPPLIGLILGDQPSSRHRWSIVWYLTALINFVGGLVFVLFADASPRDFGSPKRPSHSASDNSAYSNEACSSSSSSSNASSLRGSPCIGPKSLVQPPIGGDSRWSPCFDRRAIKLRQPEGAQMHIGGYVDTLISAPGSPIIYPFRTVKGVAAIQQHEPADSHNSVWSRLKSWRLGAPRHAHKVALNSKKLMTYL